MYELQIIGDCDHEVAAYIVESGRLKLDLDVNDIKKAIYVVGKVINFVACPPKN